MRRILNPKHATKLPALTVILRALGLRLVIRMEKEAMKLVDALDERGYLAPGT